MKSKLFVITLILASLLFTPFAGCASALSGMKDPDFEFEDTSEDFQSPEQLIHAYNSALFPLGLIGPSRDADGVSLGYKIVADMHSIYEPVDIFSESRLDSMSELAMANAELCRSVIRKIGVFEAMRYRMGPFPPDSKYGDTFILDLVSLVNESEEHAAVFGYMAQSDKVEDTSGKYLFEYELVKTESGWKIVFKSISISERYLMSLMYSGEISECFLEAAIQVNSGEFDAVGLIDEYLKSCMSAIGKK